MYRLDALQLLLPAGWGSMSSPADMTPSPRGMPMWQSEGVAAVFRYSRGSF